MITSIALVPGFWYFWYTFRFDYGLGPLRNTLNVASAGLQLLCSASLQEHSFKVLEQI